jgi:hypothetical protein
LLEWRYDDFAKAAIDTKRILCNHTDPYWCLNPRLETSPSGLLKKGNQRTLFA